MTKPSQANREKMRKRFSKKFTDNVLKEGYGNDWKGLIEPSDMLKFIEKEIAQALAEQRYSFLSMTEERFRNEKNADLQRKQFASITAETP